MGRGSNSEVCRLCGNSEEVVVDLFDKNISKVDLVNVIVNTLHLTVKESDGLPKKICVTCKKIVEEFERFRQSCVLAEKSFKVTRDDDSASNKSKTSLELQSNSVYPKEDVQDLNINEQIDLVRNIKVEIEEDERVDDCDGTFFSGDETDFEEAVIKEPHKDDYILVKQDTFTLDENARRTLNNYVEYSKPGIIPADRLLAENVKKRQVLPEMWDVYEVETQENMTRVAMRRYIISKGAFPCSLCNKCISVKSDVHEEEGWDESSEYQGHTEGVVEEIFEEGNVEQKGHENGKVCSVIPSCDICKKTFNRTQSLKRHYRTHFGYDRLPCEICGKGFSRKEHLSRHMILHSSGRPFECVNCKKGFTRKEHLTRHTLLYKGRDCSDFPTKMGKYSNDLGGAARKKRKRSYVCRPKPYSCDSCDAGFGQKEHLIKHLRRMHNRSSSGSSTLHIASVTTEEDVSESNDEVRESDAQPVSSTALAPNSRSFLLPGLTPTSVPTSSPTPASSPIPATSPRTSALPSETLSTRSEKKLFLCELCPRSFSRSEQLGRHLKVHRRDSMFVNESRIPESETILS